MADKQFRQHIETIRREIAALRKQQETEVLAESVNALEELQLIYEEMQTRLEAAEVIEEELLQQNQQVATEYRYYLDLFQLSPIAYVVTDRDGLILEGNQTFAQLLNLPQSYLPGKPLVVFVDQADRFEFRTRLNQLSSARSLQQWRVRLCAQKAEPFEAELHVAINRNKVGFIETLRIAVYNRSQSQQRAAQLNQLWSLRPIGAVGTQPVPRLPQALDGLRVLVVDDEVDARDFIAAVLESHGIHVTTVATAAAALEAIESVHPDVLVCDIRMPDEDGYSLIRQIRALEAEQGRHLPAAAITAYVDEDREKAIAAGFEAHLHKLAQPTDWVEMVTALAKQSSS
jgi:CheY-like chemotaxis protein